MLLLADRAVAVEATEPKSMFDAAPAVTEQALDHGDEDLERGGGRCGYRRAGGHGCKDGGNDEGRFFHEECLQV